MRLVEKVHLSNGLALEFWDESRRVAGDRWYVGVRAIVGIPWRPDSPPHGLAEAFRIMEQELGDELCFQRVMERHFIAEEEVPRVLAQLKELFIQNSMDYLSHPEFARRFVEKKATEIQKRIPWGREYVEKILCELRRPASWQEGKRGSD